MLSENKCGVSRLPWGPHLSCTRHPSGSCNSSEWGTLAKIGEQMGIEGLYVVFNWQLPGTPSSLSPRSQNSHPGRLLLTSDPHLQVLVSNPHSLGLETRMFEDSYTTYRDSKFKLVSDTEELKGGPLPLTPGCQTLDPNRLQPPRGATTLLLPRCPMGGALVV